MVLLYAFLLINFSFWYQLHIIVPSFCFIVALACPVWYLSIRFPAKGHVAELQPLSPVVESSPYQTRLPYRKLELPVFDGRPESYSRFILQFEKITQQMKVDDFGKYTLLHQQLQGEAKLLVSSIPVGNMDYDYAKKLLDKVYLSKEAQQFAILDRLSQLKMCNTEPFKWISEVNVINEQCSNLTIDINVVLQYFFWSSLTESFRQQLISITNNSRPTLSQIIDNIFEANNRVKEFGGIDGACEGEKAVGSETISMATGVDSDKSAQKVNKVFCILCSNDQHKLRDCQKFSTPREKVDKLKQLSRCTKCTGRHLTKKCFARLSKCTKCSDYHLGFLCCGGSFVQDKKSGNNTQKTKHKDGPGVAAVSKVSTFTGSSLGDIILPTFTASFIGPLESNLSVRALYDPDSQASYVREDVANTLNASVLEPDVTLCIKGFNSNKSLKTKRVQLSLSVGGENVKLSAFCIPSIDLQLNIGGLGDVVQMFKDKGWDLADKHLSGSIVSDFQFLLGSDNGHVLPTKSVTFGSSDHGGPSCVLESSLGMLLQGSAKQLIKNLPLMTNKNE